MLDSRSPWVTRQAGALPAWTWPSGEGSTSNNQTNKDDNFIADQYAEKKVQKDG